MPHVYEPPTGRDESKEEQADRKWGELLQEVRVAQTGIQILLAFLLTSAFSPRFPELDGFGHRLYVVTILFGAGATGALIAPVTLHRMVTGHRLKPQTVLWASRFTMVGLVLLLCTVGAALTLILRFVLEGDLAIWLAAGVLVWFVGCWFLPAAWLRHRRRPEPVRESIGNGPYGPSGPGGQRRYGRGGGTSRARRMRRARRGERQETGGQGTEEQHRPGRPE